MVGSRQLVNNGLDFFNDLGLGFAGNGAAFNF